jgi:hypothetical protein
MAVFILTLALSLFMSGALWFGLGSRINLNDDQDVNELLNFAAYFLGSLPVSFVLIFFGLGGL